MTQPRNFKDFGIKTDLTSFVGEKIKIERVLNKEITVTDYKITNSKFEGMRLDLQIQFGGEPRVIFTSSAFLMDLIKKIDRSHFPFNTVIEKRGEHFEFT